METQHARVVHFVDVIAREHDEVLRVFAHDRVQILVNRVGSALVPMLAHALLRRENLDELTPLLPDNAPTHPDVTIKRQRPVLRCDADPSQPRVDAVTEREVDDAIGSAEVDRRLRAVLRQRVKTLARAASKDDDKAVVNQRRHRLGQLLRSTTRAGAPSDPITGSGRQSISYVPGAPSRGVRPSITMTPPPRRMWGAGAPGFLNSSTER